jgi:hypothetical protein
VVTPERRLDDDRVIQARERLATVPTRHEPEADDDRGGEQSNDRRPTEPDDPFPGPVPRRIRPIR